MAKLKHLIYAIVLFAAIISVGWHLTKPPKRLSLSKTAQEKVIFNHLVTTTYDKEGRISTQFTSPYATHNESSKINTAIKPHIIATQDKKATKNTENVYVDADTIINNDVSRKTNYKGHVNLQQGQSYLKADAATTITDNNNKLVKAIAKALPSQRVHFWRISDKEKPAVHAYAKTIIYLPQAGHIQLEGNAYVKQGKNIYRSEKIIYDVNKQIVISKTQAHKRTSITLDTKTL
jgi:lipopolysaccharide transport protein LptA